MAIENPITLYSLKNESSLLGLSVTVILPVINETYSLVETVDEILRNSKNNIASFIIVIADRTTQESLIMIGKLISRYGDLIVVHRQILPFIGGAIREAFDMVKSSHVIMMASDLETDPSLVPLLIERAYLNPEKIITVTRWGLGGGFKNYSKIKLLANWHFQKIFKLLYWTSLSDMTFAFRIFPTSVVRKIIWQEFRHPFLFETIIKPLRVGVQVIEIPGFWTARTEGKSQNSFFRNFEYFRVGLKVRFMRKNDIVKNN